MPRKLLILFAMLHCLLAMGQTNYSFSSYTVNDGLPQGSIWDIAQDKNSFIWASTSDGLCRFDGFRFTVYRNNPNEPHSINCSKENTFFIDSQQRLWTISAEGISLYNDTADNFTTIFAHKPASFQQSTRNRIYGEWNGFIWAGISNYGLIKIDASTFQCQQLKKTGSYDLSIYGYWLDGFVENGHIYGNVDAAFFRYSISKNSIDITGATINSIDVINYSKQEIATCNKESLFFIDKKTMQQRLVPIQLPKGADLVLNIKVNPSNSNEMVLATPVGLQFINIKTGKLAHSITSLSNGNDDNFSYASVFFTDRSGNWWIGTNGDGLRKIAYPFKHFKLYQPSNGGTGLVKSIYADSANLYVGYFNNGLDVFSRKDGLLKHHDIPHYGSSAINNVYSIVPLSSDMLLCYVFGETETLFTGYSISQKRFFNLTPQVLKSFGLQTSITQDLQFYLCKGKGGNALLSCNSNIVSIKLLGNKLNVEPVTTLPNEKISCLFEDGRNLWAGTYTGLYCYENSKWDKVELGKPLLVKSINKSNDGTIWAGTVEGIYLIDKNRKATTHYDEHNGLLNSFVYGLLKADDNSMWFSTNKGIGSYSFNEKRFRSYTKDDGLQANEFNTGAYYKAADGELFFGGVKGTNSFFPDEIKDNQYVPPVKITSIKLFDKPYATTVAYWNVQSLTLPYTDNSLSFEFILPEFTNQSMNQYAYTMDGIDKQWISSGNNKFARYPALPPGNYTFMVKACNADGVWNKQPTILHIEIVPPFWQRLWFRILIGLAFISIIAATVFFIQKYQFRKKMRALEMQHKMQLERERISRDLHDNVGTQLSLINRSIQGMLDENNQFSDEDRKKKLQSTGQSSMEVISALRETIWALNKEEVSIQEFFDKLKAFAQKQAALSPQTELAFSETIDNVQLMLGTAEALHIFRICQEAITNALKYANASLLTINMKTVQQKYTLTIADNGTGFDQQGINSTMHYGLENMKHRAKEIACSLTIQSTANKGTIIAIAKE